jgi:hypothetical protein
MVSETDIFDVVRKAVKQIGKEAATHRFTLDEKNLLADIEYTYKRQGIRTSENELTRIAAFSPAGPGSCKACLCSLPDDVALELG